MVVTAQVGHDAEARYDDVVIARLAAEDTASHMSDARLCCRGKCEVWFLHVGDKESHKLVDVVCRVKDAPVVRQFLQHLQTLKDTQETTSPLQTYPTGVKVLRTVEVCCWRT